MSEGEWATGTSIERIWESLMRAHPLPAPLVEHEAAIRRLFVEGAAAVLQLTAVLSDEKEYSGEEFELLMNRFAKSVYDYRAGHPLPGQVTRCNG